MQRPRNHSWQTESFRRKSAVQQDWYVQEMRRILVTDLKYLPYA